jgi:hypothetical protein
MSSFRCSALYPTRAGCRVSPAKTKKGDGRKAYLDDIVQGLHRLFNGGLLIEAMALQQIDIIELEPPERMVCRLIE